MRRTFVAVVLVLAAATPVTAAPRDQLRDAAGDTRYGRPAGYDILSGGWSLAGGKRPAHLLGRLVLAAPPVRDGTAYYLLEADVEHCRLEFSYAAGYAFSEYGGDASASANCRAVGDPEAVTVGSLVPVTAAVSGNTITWKVALRDLPPPVRPGVAFRKLLGASAIADPVFGTGMSRILDSVDFAHGDESWRMGSDRP